MRYIFTDHRALWAIKECKGRATCTDILREMARFMNYPVSCECLSSALCALSAGGYVTLTDAVLTPATEVALTEQGEALVAVPKLATFLKNESAIQKARRRSLTALCAEERPTAEALPCDKASFTDVLSEIERDFEDMRLFAICDREDGLYTLTIKRPYSEGFEDDPDAPGAEDATLLTDLDGIRAMLGDLASMAIHIQESSRIRKVALHGAGRSLILTAAYAADDWDESELPLRLTVSPILFNRARFVGKRDSDLDYAQCGANLFTLGLSSDAELGNLILEGGAVRNDLWDESLSELFATLHKTLL